MSASQPQSQQAPQHNNEGLESNAAGSNIEVGENEARGGVPLLNGGSDGSEHVRQVLAALEEAHEVGVAAEVVHLQKGKSSKERSQSFKQQLH